MGQDTRPSSRSGRIHAPRGLSRLAPWPFPRSAVFRLPPWGSLNNFAYKKRFYGLSRKILEVAGVAFRSLTSVFAPSRPSSRSGRFRAPHGLSRLAPWPFPRSATFRLPPWGVLINFPTRKIYRLLGEFLEVAGVEPAS